MMEIRLFGGVAASKDRRPVSLGPPKCQTVLAALALSAGAAVAVPRLVELVWGASPPRTAEKTLQSYVTRLRKGLGPESIVRVGAAYRLDIDDASVDVSRFRRRLADGEVSAALDEWSGVPLAGLEATGLGAAVDGLVEQWLSAVELDLTARLASDAGVGSVVGLLTELTAQYPFREGLWALLMTALYREGRQADALAAYRRARQHLVEELGVEPGPRLRELESLVLGQDDRLRAAGAFPAERSTLPTGTVTFCFCEVEQTAEATGGLDDIERLVRATTDRYNGHVFSVVRDAFGTGSFGPRGGSIGVAFHRAGDAVAWADEVGGTGLPGPVARFGLHTGEADEQGRRYFGPDVNLASRLASVGHGGQVLLSSVTAALLGRTVRVQDLGSFRLDGIVADQRILQLGDNGFPRLRTENRSRGNLPRRVGRLIGRERALAALTRSLEDGPLVTLVGPGGIGKTSLAVAGAQLAEPDNVDGVWLVELAGIAFSADVVRAVADVLQVQERPDKSLTDSIVENLRGKRALLVLDNCEHVVAGAAKLAGAIIDGCLDVTVLATSREGLGLVDERLIAVTPLDPAGPASELFNERAGAVSSTFDEMESREIVGEICRRLDGVPLAIELAAARTSTMSPVDVVERLDDRLRLLTGGRRTSMERHRTLRATIQWSYELMSEQERELFQQLSIFTGPFDLAAVENVMAGENMMAGAPTAADPSAAGTISAPPALDRTPCWHTGLDAGDLLGGLVEQSMVIVESGPFGRRFRLLETMRQFGAEHLQESGQTDRIAARHADWSLIRVTEIGRLLAGPEESEAVTMLNELWPNLRTAFDWALATGNPRLARNLVAPIATEILLRHQAEIGDWAERILVAVSARPDPDSDHHDLVVFGLLWAAHRYTLSQDHRSYELLIERHGEPDDAVLHYARAFLYEDNQGLATWGPQAVAEFRSRGENHLAELAEMGGLGQALLGLGRLEEHVALADELVARYRAAGPPTFQHWSLCMAGYSYALRGDPQRAEQLFDEAADIAVPPRTLSLNRPIEARAALRRGDRIAALEILNTHVEDLLEMENLYAARTICVEFINTMVAVGEHEEAAYLLDYLDDPNVADRDFHQALVADAASEVATGKAAVQTHPGAITALTPCRDFDERGLLEHMGGVLSRLVEAG